MPMVKFLAPTDPRFTATLEAVEKELVRDSLVFRYDPRSSPDASMGRREPSRCARSGTSKR